MATRNESSPLEHAIDLFIHLPVGFLLGLPRSLPQCIDRGKQEVEQFSRQASSTLRALGLRTDIGGSRAEPAPEAATDHAVPDDTTEASDVSEVSDTTVEPGGSPLTPPLDVPGIDAELLPIPGYDSLSASQVIPRLDDLDVEELELVRSYEASARGRKTILSRVAQLQGS